MRVARWRSGRRAGGGRRLFLIFINDIAREFPSGVEVTLFADDLAIFATEKTVAEAEMRMQAALDELRKWAELCKMDVSIKKTILHL